MKTKIHLFLKQTTLALGAMAATSAAHASSDYGPAIWNPPSGCTKYYSSGNGHKFHVIHDMEGYYISSISTLRSCGTTVSVHYAVNGLKDASSDAAPGEITQMVNDVNYAWHVACWNTYCTGTEHEGFASNPAWYTEAMYQASAGITKNLQSKFGWAKDRNHIVGHNEHNNAAWRSYASANFGIDPTCNTHQDPGVYWDWSHYMDLVSGTIGGGVDASSRGSGMLDVFTRGSDNHLWKISYGSGAWSTWQNLGEVLSSDPCSVSKDANTVDVFWNGNGALWHKTWTSAGGWTVSASLGGTIAGGPTACSRTNTSVDVFARGTNGHLQKDSWNSTTGWSGWSDLGETLTSDPAACTKDTTSLDIYFRGSDGACWHKNWTTGGGWTGASSIGGGLVGSPAACSRAGNEEDVIVRGTDNAMYKNSWSSTAGWSGFQNLGGVVVADPAAVSWDSTRIDTFTRGSDGNIWQKYWTTTGGWSGFVNLGRE